MIAESAGGTKVIMNKGDNLYIVKSSYVDALYMLWDDYSCNVLKIGTLQECYEYKRFLIENDLD